MIWLLRHLKPDFKTIADFPPRQPQRLPALVFRQFVLLCKQLDLFGRELLAVDGTRIKAVNNKDRNFTRASLTEFIELADKKLDNYLKRLDTSDAAEQEIRRFAGQEPGGEDRGSSRASRTLPSDAGGTRSHRREPDFADRSRQPGYGGTYATLP